MRPDMASLVLQTVEGLLAEGALVRPWEVLSLLVMRGLGVLEKGSHEAHGSSGHGRLCLWSSDVGRMQGRTLMVVGGVRV